MDAPSRSIPRRADTGVGVESEGGVPVTGFDPVEMAGLLSGFDPSGLTRIVHCTQTGRTHPHRVVEFTFLGYTFRPRQTRTNNGRRATAFLPAVSNTAKKHRARTIRGWHLGRRTRLTFTDLATMIDPTVAGWINYYGRFYKSLLIHFLQERINPHLTKWAMRKFKHLHRAPAKAGRRLARIATNNPGTFTHWRHGAHQPVRQHEPCDARVSRTVPQSGGG